MLTIIGWIILGLIAGLIAKAIMPGKDPGGAIITILLGIVGAVIGGVIGRTLLGYGRDTDGGLSEPGTIMSSCSRASGHRHARGLQAHQGPKLRA